MPYRLLIDDASVEDALRRIAGEQLDRARAEIADPQLPTAATVHQVRKRMKKLRALLRLLRPALGERFGEENARLRDAARSLSGLRDAAARLEAFDSLVEHFAAVVPPESFAAVRRALAEQRGELPGAAERLESFAAVLAAVRRDVAGWELEGEGWQALGGGLARSYGRAREAMERAAEQPSAAFLHEGRKLVKVHWYHCRLLSDLWRPAMLPRRQAARHLASLLGGDHDLAVLAAAVAADPGRHGEEITLETFFGLLERRRAGLQEKAFRLGRLLLADEPQALAARFGAWWEVWREGRGAAR